MKPKIAGRRERRRRRQTMLCRPIDSARKRGRCGKEKEWVDCVERDVCAFGISGNWEAEWYNTVIERAEINGLPEGG